jgi:uncharacterized membrane protein YfcA
LKSTGPGWFPGNRSISNAEMSWPYIGVALLCAGFIQGLTGFGFGLVSMSMLPFVVTVKQAAAISTVFTLVATVVTFVRHCREYDWRLGLAFLVCVCAGVPIGVVVLDRGSERLLIRILGGVMIAFTAREFFFRKQPQKLPSGITVPLGLFSGILSGAFNLGGMPTAAYAYAHPWTRGEIMAFLQVMITSSCVLRLIFYGKFGMFAQFSPWVALSLILPLYGAIWFGHWVMQRFAAQDIRKWVFVFIGCMGIYYLVKG